MHRLKFIYVFFIVLETLNSGVFAYIIIDKKGLVQLNLIATIIFTKKIKIKL